MQKNHNWWFVFVLRSSKVFLKNINFLFQITAHHLLGHRGEHGNISHGKDKKKLKRKLIKNKNKKKATHSLNGNFNLLDMRNLQEQVKKAFCS